MADLHSLKLFSGGGGEEGEEDRAQVQQLNQQAPPWPGALSAFLVFLISSDINTKCFKLCPSHCGLPEHREESKSVPNHLKSILVIITHSA